MDDAREIEERKVILGICAMEKKAGSKPMKAILERIRNVGQFDIIVFEQKTILDSPIEEWPHPVDVLISFYSDGFPLDKAIEYVGLRRPYCINDLTAQRLLLDRRRVYALLQENKITCPNAIIIERDGESNDLVGYTPDQFVEGDDFLQLGDRKVSKPFVEKPINAEDHNVCIYYPSSAGGGVKSLFRKVGDRSSNFDPNNSQVRRDGSYMYEPFMQTQGTDIKVYTVGPAYAHAEARKSPVVDGVVMRNDDGKEIRFPVILTQREKEMARLICLAFGQFVCGFDMLRTSEGSMVIDVNGWSFVKGMPKYYDDAAQLLCAHMLEARGIRPIPRSLDSPSSPTSHVNAEIKPEAETHRLGRSRTPADDDQWAQKELLAVLAVVRHADRTPKNKMKMLTRRQDFLKLHQRWSVSQKGLRKEVKLKSPRQLQELLDLTKAILGRGTSRESREISPKEEDFGSALSNGGLESSDGEDMKFLRQRTMSMDDDEREACSLICAVLEEGGNFSGIYRKVQLKPLTWDERGDVEELLLVLKYGGILTPAGIAQAEGLGRRFRAEMYPGESHGADQYTSGLLRLHATQRHDLKVYSSDEGRVQMSAAAFARGLLALEKGSLTPICAALVETDSKMLDELPRQAEKQMSQAKQALHERIHDPVCEGIPETTPEFVVSAIAEGKPSIFGPSLSQLLEQEIGNASGNAPSLANAMLTCLLESVKVVVDGLQHLNSDVVRQVPCAEKAETSDGESLEAPTICGISSPVLVVKRWEKLYSELWDAKKRSWNISKVPEIFDAVQFDMIHFPKLVKGIPELYAIAKELNDVIVPQEYGSDESSRLEIGSLVCGPLLKKLVEDLRSGRESILANDNAAPEQKIVFAAQILRRFGDWLPEWMTRKAGAAKDPETNKKRDDVSESKKDEEEFLGLDPELAPEFIKSPDRRVRTRLYFTSESHIQALMNVLRYCHWDQRELERQKSIQLETSTQRQSSQRQCLTVEHSTTGPSLITTKVSSAEDFSSTGSAGSEPPSPGCPSPRPRIVHPEQEAKLRAQPVFGYLTQIVFRLYENKTAEVGSNERYLVDVLFSPGAAGDPSECKNHIMNVERLEPLRNQPLTLARLLKLLGPC